MDKISIIPHSSIDQKKWDKAILSSPFPLVFAQSFYLNATAPNWNALVIDNYKVVMPLTASKKLNISYLHQPPFTSQLGVYGEASKKELEEINEILKREYKFIEIELNADNKFKEHVKEKLTHVIDLKKNFTYNENTKRNIARSKKAELEVKEVKSLEHCLKLASSRLVPWLRNNHKTGPKQLKFLLKLIENAYGNNSLKVFVTEDQSGNQLALGYFIFNRFHCVFLKGFSFNKKDNTGSMHALLDHAIGYFKDKVELFDFGGGASAGLSTFYKGLGGKELKYQVLRINNLPWPLKMIKE
jgi:hypothetical protein